MSPTAPACRAASSTSISRARKSCSSPRCSTCTTSIRRIGAPPCRRPATIRRGSCRRWCAADFDRSICNKRKLAAWCAFWGEAKSRPTYQALSGARDEAYQQVFIDLCATLKQSGGYDYEPQVDGAGAVSAMLEGLWLRLMMGTEDVTRETAHAGGQRTFWPRLSRSIFRGSDSRPRKIA